MPCFACGIPRFRVIRSYGWTHYKPSFVAADLWPTSFADFLQSIGIFVYCMGFILFLLTQYVAFVIARYS